ncbi:MAG: CoA pyrophosphatase [Nitrososphaerales archaeon]|jgi:8-oxo-dGTP pyrophosphatase MutT (NUDIX family)
MKVIQALSGKLYATEPSAGQLRRASVAVTFDDPESPSVLLIKRADLVGDPWSGQVAFPGGKAQEGDGTLKETAIRETREEAGIDLGQDADFLGYFMPFRTHTGTLDVFPAVFLLKRKVEVRPNKEVSSYRWVKLENLTAEQAKSSHQVDANGQPREVPALLVDGYVIWGLTHRIISSLLG